MTTKVLIRNLDDGTDLGWAAIEDSLLVVSDPSLQSLIEGFIRREGSLEAAFAKLDGYTNGYWSSVGADDEPKTLTAAGFNADQLRIPRGNGDLSGRWMDSPLKILDDLRVALNEITDDAPIFKAVQSATQTAKEFDPRTDEGSLDEAWDYLDTANSRTPIGSDEERLITAAMGKIDELYDVDWSLFSEDTDIRGDDIGEIEVEATDIGADAPEGVVRQVRIPKDNGGLSGAWVETPRTLMDRAAEGSSAGPKITILDAISEWRENIPNNVRPGDLTWQQFLKEALVEFRKAETEADEAGEDHAELDILIDRFQELADVDWTLLDPDTDLLISDEEDQDTLPVIEAEPGYELQQMLSLFDDDNLTDDAAGALGGAIAEAMTAIMNEGAEKVGLKGRISGVSFDGDDLRLSWTLHDPSQSNLRVGTIDRRINIPNKHVENMYFQIRKAYQGGGFASYLTGAFETYYADNGIDSIEVHANIDVGGYTWARLGFDLSSGHGAISEAVLSMLPKVIENSDTPAATAAQARRLQMNYGDDFDWLGDDWLERVIEESADYLPEGMADEWRERWEEQDYDIRYEIVDDVLDYLNPGDETSQIEEWLNQLNTGDTFDQMYWVATFGQESMSWEEVVTIDDKPKTIKMWPGKQALLDTDWNGIKQLGDGW